MKSLWFLDCWFDKKSYVKESLWALFLTFYWLNVNHENNWQINQYWRWSLVAALLSNCWILYLTVIHFAVFLMLHSDCFDHEALGSQPRKHWPFVMTVKGLCRWCGADCWRRVVQVRCRASCCLSHTALDCIPLSCRCTRPSSCANNFILAQSMLIPPLLITV